MNALAQSEIIELIADLNSFADRAERLITTTQTNYDKDKQLLLNKHNSALSRLEALYKANYTSVQHKSRKTIAEAKGILAEIDKLDVHLSSADKYYVKTKQKKEELLSSAISNAYDDVTDYFEILNQIRIEFSELSHKYSEDILPGLINGLNYLLSNKRKKDYEALIVLRNTVSAFVKEIETELPPITEESLSTLKEDYFTHRESLVEQSENELSAFELNYSTSLESVADKICTELDEILPDEFVDYLYAIMGNYSKVVYMVNSSSTIQDEVLNMCYVDYPVDFFVQSKIVASIIKEKCSQILVNDSIRMPLMMSKRDAPVWLITSDNSNNSALQAFLHSIMYGVLSSCPVERLTYTIIDPENRGNSISPFFDAKKKLPELFGERIYISKDEIADRIRKLNEKIETILQDKLGNQYSTIYDYAKDTSDYNLGVELVVLYDFPKGFDERTLGDLRNVLRNGSRCGIYTVISYFPEYDANYSQEYQKNLQSIASLATVIAQSGDQFFLRGLPMVYHEMPEKSEFSKFFSKYMLIFEGIKNRGIAFSPLIKKLIEAKESLELDTHIERLCTMMSSYVQNYAHVPVLDAVFPSLVTLGNVLYPADIFSDSIGYTQIVEKFGVECTTETENTSFVELPLTFDLRNSFNLFLHCSETGNKQILSFTHHVIWSFLSVMPVTKVNICVFDGEQRGNSIIPFLDFNKRSPEVFDQKIYTNSNSMQDRLIGLNSQIDEFIQNKLGNRYKDILDYNLNTPNRAEPITLLALYDFPSGMNDQTLNLLANILRNGNKCGIFTVICYNPNIQFSRYESIDNRLEQIMKYCATITYKEGQYCLLPYNLQIRLPQLPSYENINNFIDEYIERSDTIKKRGLSFKDILSKELFSLNSAKSLKIPIGVGDGDSIVRLTMGEGSSHHGLIAGATGSGKSTLLHTLIMSCMLNYSPDQLHLYLMDFKSGTEFKIYESVKLPHIQLLALDTMQEFGESILENLVAEMEKRANAFKNDAGGVTKIKDYIEATGKPMPRILVIMDEFQILFNDSTNRKVAMHCAELAKRIVTEGRAFGIHLLMSTQSTKIISDLTISHGTIEQMRIRIGLKCSESDARYLFSDQNDSTALNMMKGPIGTAVMNLDYVEQSNVGFRAAYCDDETQKYYLDLISKTYADYPANLQIFEGSRTTDLLEYFNANHITKTGDLSVKIYMGTPIKVAEPIVLSIDRKRKHNLLVCGSDDKMATMLSNNYIISALLNQNATVYCIDGDKLVGEEGSAAMYETLTECSTRFKLAEDRADIINFINEIYKNYQTWKKHNSTDVIFVIIKNLQFLDIVKSMFKGDMVDENEFIDRVNIEPDPADPFAAINNMFSGSSNKDNNLSIGEKLIKMIEDGSGFGIHFIVSSLEYQTVKECMYYGENILTKFPERIIFSLGSNDADSLIENISVAGLKNNTVYYTDGVKETYQMQPYITPIPEELNTWFK